MNSIDPFRNMDTLPFSDVYWKTKIPQIARIQNVVKVPGTVDEVVTVVVEFNVVVVVVANGSRVVVVVAVVVVIEDGGAGADGRTRHGWLESMEKKSKSRAEMNFMLELLWALSSLVL